MISNIRLSRISHPRATVWAMLLLAVVFLGFGVWAEACLPDSPIAAPSRAPADAGYIEKIGALVPGTNAPIYTGVPLK